MLPLAVIISFCLRAEPALATPVFAQAYGLKCTACHTQMPFLNSYGRYVQRTGYSALSPSALKHTFPVFLLDARTGYSYQANPQAPTHTFTGPGNTTDAYAVGALGDNVTWHIEQWITFVGRPGFLDTTWVAFNGIAHHTGHLFVGKLPALNMDENEAPFVLRDINDASYTLPVISGVHDYSLDESGARWGAKYNQFFGRFITEVQYLGDSSGLGSFNEAYNFSIANGSDRSLQWRTAYADPAHPWEAGIFGETGTLAWTGTYLPTTLYRDNYTLLGPYIMKDPRPGSPGFRLQYASTSDRNPGFINPLQSAPRANGDYMVGSLYQMFVQDRMMANVTYFHTNMPYAPLGTPGGPLTGLVAPAGPQTAGSAGVSYAFSPYVRIFAAGTMITNQKPFYSFLFWLTPPLRDRHQQ